MSEHDWHFSEHDWRLQAIEAWIDAKIAFARMTPSDRAEFWQVLREKREGALEALKHIVASNPEGEGM